MWTDIAEATASAYTPASTDESNLLRVTVSYDDAGGGGRSATSASTQKVGKTGVVSLVSNGLKLSQKLRTGIEPPE